MHITTLINVPHMNSRATPTQDKGRWGSGVGVKAHDNEREL
jgi:hypothetical protein